ncbi:MAG: SPFH domain-containing protein [Oscillospiraceae bacterium]|nr:SPFH domain-containing protein [Oscillospiraceae bacterium]
MKENANENVKNTATHNENHDIKENAVKAASGIPAIILGVITIVLAIAAIIFAAKELNEAEDELRQAAVWAIPVLVTGIVYTSIGWLWMIGIKVVNPNEAAVMTLFGKYTGTLRNEGIYYVNPFTSVKKISLKVKTHDNSKQKINDEMGNPIEVGIVVVWRITDSAKAVFGVDNYKEFVSIQSDSALRDVVRLYPYDKSENSDNDKSLRGSSAEVAEDLKKELQGRVQVAGVEIIEARITHLAYAPEIAAVMLQRQQATAIIEARQKIVDGAVGMVEMALERLAENNVCDLDEERKAQMVSNLLVVLCGNKDAQPIVNSGSIY